MQYCVCFKLFTMKVANEKLIKLENYWVNEQKNFKPFNINNMWTDL